MLTKRRTRRATEVTLIVSNEIGQSGRSICTINVTIILAVDDQSVLGTAGIQIWNSL